ncbi:MAG TPA: Ig-like domain-containing protein [Candidatus Moranbacteria bacterium]|nr:Ig-like domain-containing protein [Candidatus Moranbacteria bacterium]HRZ33910.1 Ig-like domain-containing protein [Candidatus Moranbacteria bacterium]
MKKIKNTKKILKYNLLVAGIFVFAYLIFGFIGSQKMSFSEIKNEGRIAGTMISVFVSPFVKVTTFDGKNIEDFSGTPSTKQKRPIFTGTSSISNAIIELEIQEKNKTIYATTIADGSGNWEWLPSEDLSEGTNTLYIETSDPAEPAFVATFSFLFEIQKKSNGEDEDDDEDKDETAILPPSSYTINEPQKGNAALAERPVDFSLLINKGKEVFRGDNLEIEVTFLNVKDDFGEVTISFVLISPDNKVIKEYPYVIYLKNNEKVTRKIYLPNDLKLGKYKLQANLTVKDNIISQERSFFLKDRPIMEIGTGNIITYDDIINNLGWIGLYFLVFLSIIIFLIRREYIIYKRSRNHVTEEVLYKKGFIS